MARAPALLLAALFALALLRPAPASASSAVPDGLPPGSVSATRATGIADHDPKVVAERRENGGLTSNANVVESHWEVAYFAGDKEVAVVLVDPLKAEVTESWTGYQVAWKMARGYPGAFGHKLNAPYVFLPICAAFLIGLFDWRRPWRVANLDLLVLLGFGVSNYFFNRAEIGVSVPLVYPLLVYLLGRALWLGLRGGEGLRPRWSTTTLLVAALFLVGLRVGLNMADSGAIDVGYAGVVGADRVAHGEPLYGNFPEDVSEGDTYGPVNYFAYVPFERIWPWTGTWNDLPAAHGAAVFFDLATLALLVLLGYRIRPGPGGRRLAAILAFGWAAYPYTAYVLESNSNDSLVAMLLVATLVLLARPLARGALASLAVFTKFAPALLVPMLATYSAPSAGGAGLGGPRTEAKPPPAGPPKAATGPAVRAFSLAFIGVTIAVMLWPAIDPGLHTFWERTIEYQDHRDSPFSIWGQVGLEPLRIAIGAAVALLSIGLAFRPRRKTLTQVAALAAALMIGSQLIAEHWFYLYIVWFYPLLLVAMATVTPGRGPSPARSSPPAPAR